MGLAMKLSDGEKLILCMLSEIYDKLKIKGEMDPDFVREAIYGGHFWAFKWKMPGVFHDHEDNETTVREVADILDMWRFMERTYKKLKSVDKKRIKDECAPLGDNVKFPGFDGNNESEHLGIAKFFRERLDRWEDLNIVNSHMPTLDRYHRMLAEFKSMRPALGGREMNADDIIKLIKVGMRKP